MQTIYRKGLQLQSFVILVWMVGRTRSALPLHITSHRFWTGLQAVSDFAWCESVGGWVFTGAGKKWRPFCIDYFSHRLNCERWFTVLPEYWFDFFNCFRSLKDSCNILSSEVRIQDSWIVHSPDQDSKFFKPVCKFCKFISWDCKLFFNIIPFEWFEFKEVVKQFMNRDSFNCVWIILDFCWCNFDSSDELKNHIIIPHNQETEDQFDGCKIIPRNHEFQCCDDLFRKHQSHPYH